MVVVALALVLLVMLGQGQSAKTIALVGVAAAVVGLLALASRSRDRHGSGQTYWVSWVEGAARGASLSPAEAPRRGMLPYIGLFTLIYGVLVAGAVMVSASVQANPPMFLYLLFIWLADQGVVWWFARRVRRPFFRDELVALYSGSGLIIVLSELPTIMAISRYDAWNATTVAGFALIGALVFTVHYFGLSRLPVRALRSLGLSQSDPTRTATDP